jgi:hypothetical protein
VNKSCDAYRVLAWKVISVMLTLQFDSVPSVCDLDKAGIEILYRKLVIDSILYHNKVLLCVILYFCEQHALLCYFTCKRQSAMMTELNSKPSYGLNRFKFVLIRGMLATMQFRIFCLTVCCL